MKRKPTITIELTAYELCQLERALGLILPWEGHRLPSKRVDKIYGKIKQWKFQAEEEERKK